MCELLATTYQACSAALAKLGEPEAAWIAADRAMAAAERADNPMLVAAGAFRLVFVFLAARHYDQAEETARTAADALQPLADQGDPQAMSLWGALTLQRAVIASRVNDPDTAYGHLERARQIAGRLGEGRNDYNTEFGPANVALYEIAVAVELGTRAAPCAPPPPWTPAVCPPSGGPGCSSTLPAPTPSAARSARRSPRCARPRTSLPSRSAPMTWCASSSLTCSPCKTRHQASYAAWPHVCPPPSYHSDTFSTCQGLLMRVWSAGVDPQADRPSRSEG